MDIIREYWWLILVVVALVLGFILLRPKQRVQLSDTAPTRPHMQVAPAEREGRGLADEAAAAATELTGEILSAPVHRELSGERDSGDDFTRLKGVGPKLADTLRSLGFLSFDQLARLTPTELERIDDQLGAFRGRLARDRVVEQADYLSRNDLDGFEQRFGKL